jgi:hypothetical protein
MIGHVVGRVDAESLSSFVMALYHAMLNMLLGDEIFGGVLHSSSCQQEIALIQRHVQVNSFKPVP